VKSRTTSNEVGFTAKILLVVNRVMCQPLRNSIIDRIIALCLVIFVVLVVVDVNFDWSRSRAKVPVTYFQMSTCVDAWDFDLIIAQVIFDKFEPYTDLSIAYIVTFDGDRCIAKHGARACRGNTIQLCAHKYYPQLWWNFIQCINKDPSQVDNPVICAQQFSISMDKIDLCANSTDGLRLLQQSAQIVEKNGITWSPSMKLGDTLIGPGLDIDCKWTARKSNNTCNQSPDWWVAELCSKFNSDKPLACL